MHWARLNPMLRAFLLLAPLMLLLGLPTPVLEAAGVPVAAADDGCHCCPEVDDDGGDCCDQDLGACCAHGFAVVAPTLASAPEHPGSALGLHELLPLHLLRPRANGPPPLPPPIG